MKIRCEDIVIGSRHRKDQGDIEELAANIKLVGLLQPICVTPKNKLVDGWRRLLAVQHLGWAEVECHVHDVEKIVEGEFSATVHRKGYSISELAGLYLAVKPLLAEQAKQRKIEGGRNGGRAKHRGNSPKPETQHKHMGGRTRDLIQRYSGGLWSGQMIERAAEICQAARDEPDKYGFLQQEMDAGKRSVNSAWKRWKAMKALEAIPQQAEPPRGHYENEILQGDCVEVMVGLQDDTFDACFTDPWFGVGFWYGVEQEPVDHDPDAYWKWLRPRYEQIVRVVKPGGLIAMHLSIYYLRHFYDWFGQNIKVFAYCKTFVPIYNVGHFTEAWNPVVMLHKPGVKALWPRKKVRSLNHHTSTSPADEFGGLHPCPLPSDFCERFLASFVIEGGWVLDPFCGSGSIPLGCAATGRRYLGIDIRQDYVDLARKRLALATTVK